MGQQQSSVNKVCVTVIATYLYVNISVYFLRNALWSQAKIETLGVFFVGFFFFSTWYFTALLLKGDYRFSFMKSLVSKKSK